MYLTEYPTVTWNNGGQTFVGKKTKPQENSVVLSDARIQACFKNGYEVNVYPTVSQPIIGEISVQFDEAQQNYFWLTK